MSVLHFALSGEDQAVHGGGGGRLRRPVFLLAPGSLASPPQEKAGAQVPETGTYLLAPESQVLRWVIPQVPEMGTHKWGDFIKVAC